MIFNYPNKLFDSLAGHEKRGKILRQCFKITDSSPLKSRDLRNEIEHFDEKLDVYLFFGLAALLAYLFPVRRASLVTPTHALLSNNLIESSAAADLEWFGRFVSDKAKISRRISARRSAPSPGHSSYCRRRQLKILSALTLFFDVRGSSEALTPTGFGVASGALTFVALGRESIWVLRAFAILRSFLASSEEAVNT